MKRYLRMMFALLMVVAVMFAYTGISFAAEGEPADTNGSGEPTTTVTEPTEGTGGEGTGTPTEPTTTLGAGDTPGTELEEPITEPAAGSGNQTGDSNGEPTRDATQYTVTYEYTGEVPEGQTAPAEEQYAAGIEVTLKELLLHQAILSGDGQLRQERKLLLLQKASSACLQVTLPLAAHGQRIL